VKAIDRTMQRQCRLFRGGEPQRLLPDLRNHQSTSGARQGLGRAS
jgi:hypothetical protein